MYLSLSLYIYIYIYIHRYRYRYRYKNIENVKSNKISKYLAIFFTT